MPIDYSQEKDSRAASDRARAEAAADLAEGLVQQLSGVITDRSQLVQIAENLAELLQVQENLSNILQIVANIGNLQSIVTNLSNINTVAGVSSQVQSVAQNLSAILQSESFAGQAVAAATLSKQARNDANSFRAQAVVAQNNAAASAVTSQNAANTATQKLAQINNAVNVAQNAASNAASSASIAVNASNSASQSASSASQSEANSQFFADSIYGVLSEPTQSGELQIDVNRVYGTDSPLSGPISFEQEFPRNMAVAFVIHEDAQEPDLSEFVILAGEYEESQVNYLTFMVVADVIYLTISQRLNPPSP